jgi:hypothetical protein
MRNDNLFRQTQRALKPNELTQIDMIKNGAQELFQKFPIGTPNATIAQRKLEEAVMWAVKDISG